MSISEDFLFGVPTASHWHVGLDGTTRMYCAAIISKREALGMNSSAPCRDISATYALASLA